MRPRCFSRTLRLAPVLLGVAFATTAGATGAVPLERYVAAVRLARVGRAADASALFAELARNDPSSVPVHRALARLAAATGQNSLWTERFRSRLRRSSRDIGAAVGLAVLESARGRRDEAERLLLDAVTAGARDPLLVPLLIDNMARPDDLAGWLSARSSVIPGDGRLVALRSRVLLALNRIVEARDVVERGLARNPGHPDLLAVHADLLRAAGDVEGACAEAADLVRQWTGDARVPELRAPAHLQLARVWTACGRADDARRTIRTAGPLVFLPDDPSLVAMASVVEAELDLTEHEPLVALSRLDEVGPLPPPDAALAEAESAVALRAQVLLGVAPEGARELLTRPLPAGLALADRSTALAALALLREQRGPELSRAIDRVADALAAQGLEPRATRARILARFVVGEPVALSGPNSGAAEAIAAAGLVNSSLNLAAGDAKAALAATNPEALRAEGAPGMVLAALEVVAARSALVVGEPQRAAAAARSALLDIEAANEAGVPPAPESAPFVGRPGETAAELAGLAFRAAIAAGRTPAQAAQELLRNLGRAARNWSVVEAPWPSDLAELAPWIPADACLVIAMPGPGAPALAADRRLALAVAGPAEAPNTPPCAGRRIYWAGPAAGPGGLSPAPDDSRVLVRLIVPAPVHGGGPAKPDPHVPIVNVGPGPERPLRTLVERLARAPEDLTTTFVSRFDAAQQWPVFHGAGLSPGAAPFASGWLAPPGRASPSGWISPETIQTGAATPGAGLVALGLATTPGQGALEQGPRIIAEASLSAGWRWALLSRRPLTQEERGRVESRLASWGADPVKEAQRLVRRDPAVAQALTLWTAPATPSPPTAGSASALALGCAAFLGLAVAVHFALRTRRRGPAPTPDQGSPAS